MTDSREKYIESVEDFIERLNNLEEPKLGKFIEKINKIYFDFNKRSFKNYERATILIGKEMASIKEGVRVFSKSLLKTYEENKDITYEKAGIALGVTRKAISRYFKELGLDRYRKFPKRHIEKQRKIVGDRIKVSEMLAENPNINLDDICKQLDIQYNDLLGRYYF